MTYRLVARNDGRPVLVFAHELRLGKVARSNFSRAHQVRKRLAERDSFTRRRRTAVLVVTLVGEVGCKRRDGGAHASDAGDEYGCHVEAAQRLVDAVSETGLDRLMHDVATYEMEIRVNGAAPQGLPRNYGHNTRGQVQASGNNCRVCAGLGIVDNDIVRLEAVFLRKLAGNRDPAAHDPVAQDPVVSRDYDRYEGEDNQASRRDDCQLEDLLESHGCDSECVAGPKAQRMRTHRKGRGERSAAEDTGSMRKS